MLEVEWEEVQTLLWGGKATPKVLLLFTTRIYLGRERHLMESAEPPPILMSIIQTQNGDESAVLPESEIAQEDDGNECQDSNFVNTDENAEIESDEDHVPYRYMLVRELVEHCKTRGLTLPTTLRLDKLVHLLERNDMQERTRRRAMREIEKMQREEAESINVGGSVTGPSSGTSDLVDQEGNDPAKSPSGFPPKKEWRLSKPLRAGSRATGHLQSSSSPLYVDLDPESPFRETFVPTRSASLKGLREFEGAGDFGEEVEAESGLALKMTDGDEDAEIIEHGSDEDMEMGNPGHL